MILQKYPLLIDFHHGIIGAFVGNKPGSEPGIVIPQYIPLNNLIKRVDYPEEVPEYALVHIIGMNTNIKGVQQRYVIIKENAHGDCDFADKMGEIFKEKIKTYQDRLEDEKLDSIREKTRAKRAKQETTKRVSEDMELNKQKKQNVDQDIKDKLRNRLGNWRNDWDNNSRGEV